jgi:hypothetical protein
MEKENKKEKKKRRKEENKINGHDGLAALLRK